MASSWPFPLVFIVCFLLNGGFFPFPSLLLLPHFCTKTFVSASAVATEAYEGGAREPSGAPVSGSGVVGEDEPFQEIEAEIPLESSGSHHQDEIKRMMAAPPAPTSSDPPEPEPAAAAASSSLGHEQGGEAEESADNKGEEDVAQLLKTLKEQGRLEELLKHLNQEEGLAEANLGGLEKISKAGKGGAAAPLYLTQQPVEMDVSLVQAQEDLHLLYSHTSPSRSSLFQDLAILTAHVPSADRKKHSKLMSLRRVALALAVSTQDDELQAWLLHPADVKKPRSKRKAEQWVSHWEKDENIIQISTGA